MAERDITRLSQQQFSAQALGYSQSHVFNAGADLDAIAAMASDVQANIAVDIGSGAGFTAFAVSPFAHTVLSTDLALPMLQHAIQNAESRGLTNVAPVLVSAESLPFANNSVGLLTCRLAAHHFSDVTIGVSEWARIIEPGGAMILVDTVTPEDTDVAAWMNDIELRRDPSHSRDLSVLQWVDLLTANSFTIEETVLMKIPLEFDDWVKRSATPPDVIEKMRADYVNASDLVTEAFGIESDGPLQFFWPCLVLRASK
ncbi:MAG: class I SAM-dependent methyltransferase [Chloroflexota bacterium]|nr:class I SAM-dependent methyltransferase [Chloroflexota bacterium]